MRYYTTKPLKGGTAFKCTFCDHTVTTLDFNSTNGNRRTQAAAVINQHAALLHLRASAQIERYRFPPGVQPTTSKSRG